MEPWASHYARRISLLLDIVLVSLRRLFIPTNARECLCVFVYICVFVYRYDHNNDGEMTRRTMTTVQRR